MHEDAARRKSPTNDRGDDGGTCESGRLPLVSEAMAGSGADMARAGGGNEIFADFVAQARRDLGEALIEQATIRLEAALAGPSRPPFLAADAVEAVLRSPPQGGPVELRAYGRPASAPPEAQYRLRAVAAAGLPPEDLVALGYETVLGRAPDAAGAAGYLAAIRAGRLDAHGLLRALAASDEARARGLAFVFVPAVAA